jgi:hypothetical protein
MAGLLAVAALATGLAVLSERGRASAAGAILFEGRYAQEAMLEPTEFHTLEFESLGC